MLLRLKTRIAVCLLISAMALAACSSSHKSASEFIRWQGYADGLTAAGTQGKKIFLYFRADW